MKNNRFNAIAACSLIAGCAAFASADTVVLDYRNVIGGSSVNVASAGTYSAGHMEHNIYDSVGGTQIGSYNTFCIELGDPATRGQATYEIVRLTDAPNPGLPGSPDSYTDTQAAQVVQIIANAVDAGWIDINLQKVGSTTDAQITGIQAAIWSVLFVSAVDGNAGVDTAVSYLTNPTTNTATPNATFNLMQQRLRAAVADGQQDMLYVVPLPTSVFAGLGMLGGLAGIRSIRRRQA